MTLAGVDVSSFQQSPRDWLPVAGQIAYGAVKITEYGASAQRYENPFAAVDWAALAAADLGRIAYMFGHPAAPARASVDYFLSALEGLGLKDEDAVALDHEVSDGLTATAASEWARTVLEELQTRTGRRPLLYTFLSFADEGYCTGLGTHWLWIADPSSPPGKPRVPLPWEDWALHQYSITGPIDRDLAAYPSLKAMRAALGKHVPAPPKPRRHHSVQLPQVLTNTSVSIPAGVKHVLLSTGANTARLRYQFLPGGTWQALTLVAQDGASVVAVPAKATQLRVQRSETVESIDVALQDS